MNDIQNEIMLNKPNVQRVGYLPDDIPVNFKAIKGQYGDVVFIGELIERSFIPHLPPRIENPEAKQQYYADKIADNNKRIERQNAIEKEAESRKEFDQIQRSALRLRQLKNENSKLELALQAVKDAETGTLQNYKLAIEDYLKLLNVKLIVPLNAEIASIDARLKILNKKEQK